MLRRTGCIWVAATLALVVLPSHRALGDTAAPDTPTIARPAAGALLNKPTVPIGGMAEPRSSVTLFEGTTNFGYTNTNTLGSWSLNRTFSEGSHTVTLTATDAAGNTSAASAPRTFTIDTRVSIPSISTPAEGAVTDATSVTVTGTADPGSSVAANEGTTTLATVTANGSGAWTTGALTFTEGLHAVTARATDAAGNVSAASAARTFEVDLTAPDAPVISAPEEGAELNATPVTVSGTAEAGATVTVLEGATALGSAVAGGSGAWSVALTFADGAHSITATATDAATNTGPASGARAFSLDATVPTVAITTANSSLFVLAPVKIAGTAADASGITSVHVRYIGPGGAVALEGDATVLSPGGTAIEWTHQPAGLANGTYSVEVVARDAYENASGAASIRIAKVG